MTVRSSAGHYPIQPLRPMPEGSSGEPPPAGACKERAVATLVKGEVLRHTFGSHGEYEVRTTQAIGQPWRYQCCVLHRGKVLKRAFPPIVVDRQRDRQSVSRARGFNETMRLNWTTEAAEVHCTRCAALQEYLLLAAVNLQAPPWSRRYHVPIALLLGVLLLVAYGAWKQRPSVNSVRQSETPPAVAEKAPGAGAGRRPAEGPLNPLPAPAPPPVLSSAISDEAPAEAGPPPQKTPQTPLLKTTYLADLLANRAAGQRNGQTSQASDVQAGDLVRLTGWIHRISRDGERAYLLDLRSGREAGSPGLVAVAPPPDQVLDSPAMKAQLQSVRTFILQRLLRRREPSLRGSVMRRPVAVQLTGQLAYVEAPQGKGSRGSATSVEVHPILEIQFANAPEPSTRSR